MIADAHGWRHAKRVLDAILRTNTKREAMMSTTEIVSRPRIRAS
jgi:hypothetical protein